jgi:glycosyl transferase family 25
MSKSNITFVTAFIDLNEDRYNCKSKDNYISLFKTLANSGISICLYLSPNLENIGSELQELYSNVKFITTVKLEEMKTYKIINELSPKLPVKRCPIKDSLNYMILMNSKAEFVYNVSIINPFNTEHFAWIDFGICHVLSEPDIILKKLYNFSTSKLIHKMLLFPSCWSKEQSKKNLYNIKNNISWRFCGGFFIGDKQSIKEMYFLIQKELPQFIAWVFSDGNNTCDSNTNDSNTNDSNVNNIITWEVNLWDWLEQNCNWKVDAYNADHNNSILELPLEYIINDNNDNNNNNNDGIYKSTIVTFYFNIKELKDSTDEVRPQSFYMEKGRETLKLNYPMVIFCDNSNYEKIKQIRDEYISNSKLTNYIIKNITEYDFYKENWDIINENRKDKECYKNSRNTPSYYLLCMFKIIAINIAKQYNFYNTEYYAWIDFDGSHIMRNFDKYSKKMLNNPNQKISMCYIHYRNHNELYPIKLYLQNGGPCGVAATSFTVQKEYVNRFYNGCLSIFHETLNNCVGHCDEQILTYFYDKYPELCNIFYGDYYSILTNYHEPIEDHQCIVHFFIKEAINKGRKDLAEICATKLIKTIKKYNLSTHNLSYLKSLIPNKFDISEYIDKIIYINLETRNERKNEIEGELNSLGLSYERFNAISKPNFGILGCTLSHLAVLKMARDNKWKNILIFEDDFMFLVDKKEFEKNIELLFNESNPVDFDICMLSYNIISSEPSEKYPFLHKVLEVQTASGYIVNEKMYDKLIELYEWSMPLLESTKQHWVYANDQIWKKLQPSANWYSFTTRIGKQRPSYSDNGESWCELNC